MTEEREERTCPICCDTIDARNTSIRPCCKHPICKSCLHHHTTSVFNEGVVGDGRTDVKCPLGCGREITDTEIRDSIRDSNFSFMHHVVGRILLELLVLFGMFSCLNCLSKCRRRRLTRAGNNDVYYDCFSLLTIAAAESIEIQQYERWSLSVAMSQRSEESRQAEDVIYCPAPNCDNMWMASAPYRRRKQEHEPAPRRRHARSSADWFIGLFYKPVKLEELPPGWLDSEDIREGRRSGNGSRNDHADTADGRKVFCAKCRIEFCGLCRRPWNTLTTRGKRLCHKGKSCPSFAYSATTRAAGDDEYAFSAEAIHARICPGCSILTQRISGCNHMTCSCGMEWCYVCEVRWNVGHYSCVDRADGEATGCVIS